MLTKGEQDRIHTLRVTSTECACNQCQVVSFLIGIIDKQQAQQSSLQEQRKRTIEWYQSRWDKLLTYIKRTQNQETINTCCNIIANNSESAYGLAQHLAKADKLADSAQAVTNKGDGE